VLVDGLNQFRHTAKHSAAEALGGEFPEEAFHQIEPRATRRREMHMKAGVPYEPLLHRGVLMGGIVIDDEMERFVRGRLSINEPQEFQPFRMAMARETGGDDGAFGHIQRGKQGGGAMAFIVMRHRPTSALLEGEARLCSIQRLNLRLLVDAQDEGMLGGIQIQADHVVEFLEEVGVIAELEGPDQVRFQPMGFPDPLHQGGIGAQVLGQRAERPVRGRARRGVHRGLHNPSD